MKPITLCVKYENNAFVFLDQSVIPHHENYIATTKVSDVIEAIKALKIRGAPAIGIAGAFACDRFSVLDDGERK
jgi:methylthioribose-1-phosphate isomerase